MGVWCGHVGLVSTNRKSGSTGKHSGSQNVKMRRRSKHARLLRQCSVQKEVGCKEQEARLSGDGLCMCSLGGLNRDMWKIAILAWKAGVRMGR